MSAESDSPQTFVVSNQSELVLEVDEAIKSDFVLEDVPVKSPSELIANPVSDQDHSEELIDDLGNQALTMSDESEALHANETELVMEVDDDTNKPGSDEIKKTEDLNIEEENSTQVKLDDVSEPSCSTELLAVDSEDTLSAISNEPETITEVEEPPSKSPTNRKRAADSQVDQDKSKQPKLSGTSGIPNGMNDALKEIISSISKQLGLPPNAKILYSRNDGETCVQLGNTEKTKRILLIKKTDEVNSTKKKGDEKKTDCTMESNKGTPTTSSVTPNVALQSVLRSSATSSMQSTPSTTAIRPIGSAPTSPPMFRLVSNSLHPGTQPGLRLVSSQNIANVATPGAAMVIAPNVSTPGSMGNVAFGQMVMLQMPVSSANALANASSSSAGGKPLMVLQQVDPRGQNPQNIVVPVNPLHLPVQPLRVATPCLPMPKSNARAPKPGLRFPAPKTGQAKVGKSGNLMPKIVSTVSMAGQDTDDDIVIVGESVKSKNNGPDKWPASNGWESAGKRKLKTTTSSPVPITKPKPTTKSSFTQTVNPRQSTPSENSTNNKLTEENKELKMEITKLKRKITRLENRCIDLKLDAKLKLRSLSAKAVVEGARPYLTETTFDLFKLLIQKESGNVTNRGIRYSNTTKDFALCIYCCSKTAYRVCRHVLKLPSVRSICKSKEELAKRSVATTNPDASELQVIEEDPDQNPEEEVLLTGNGQIVDGDITDMPVIACSSEDASAIENLGT